MVEIVILGLFNIGTHFVNIYEYKRNLPSMEECYRLSSLILRRAQLHNNLPFAGVSFYTEILVEHRTVLKEILRLYPHELNTYNDLLLTPRNNMAIKRSLKHHDAVL